MDVAKEKTGYHDDFGDDDMNSRRCMLDDLQLAAELGKTLLERNKELETALRQHQNVIEDQTQEIEYLTKQTAALREVNDSRLRIYEQLEVSIQDLERANHRLAVDHAADKKHIKTLCCNIETLENKCEEFQKTVDDLNAQLEIVRRRAERKPENEKPKENDIKTVESTAINAKNVIATTQKSIVPLPELTKEDEDLLRLSDELRENKVAFAQEQRRVTELEEQLASVIQENNRLQEQLRNWHQREDEPKSMHEELSILEEVRQGQLCIRCLRGMERDDMSSILDGEDDDRSAISSLILTPGQQSPKDDHVTSKLVKFDNAKEKLLQGIWANKEDGHDNPYRELVQKYEALLEVQLSQVIRKNKPISLPNTQIQSGPISLQDELQTSGDYCQFNVKDTDEESGHGEEAQKENNQQKKVEQTSRKKIIQTPDFSEAETSSSGFSDETSNKATQTERERPGSFLCTIADGEDYRFSIYDDVSPMDSRFRNRPEYRELFKEIFTILKKAAENKDDGEQLPLLDDTTTGKVPPVTPATEEPPGNFTDDTQSVLSSVMSEQSIPVSDITTPETAISKEKEQSIPETVNMSVKNETTKQNDTKNVKENKPMVESTSENPKDTVNTKETDKEDDKEKERVLTPLVRQPLEYIAATRKKSRHRNRKHSQDRQGADSPVFPSPPKIIYQKSSSKKRRDYRPIEISPLVRTSDAEWNGSTLQFYNRNINSPTPSVSGRTGKIYQGWNAETDSWDIKQSTASQEIHKLRKLELSYAEVLRNADKTKNRRKKHQ
ncbi:cerebellar degeneration-related protein 2 isoform X2 [Pararge aegeria]|nr:cerebellar degeneration-related protein 2 isoform X2 [Pararge aegeria]